MSLTLLLRCLQPTLTEPFWTGISDRSVADQYSFAGTAAEFTINHDLWAEGFPVPGIRDCVAMTSEGMKENSCSRRYSYLCGRAISGSACAASPCGEGRCIQSDNAAGYECECTGTGLSGANCELDTQECAVNNGGCSDTCVELYRQDPVCRCSTPGYRLDDDDKTCVADACGCAQLCTHHIDGSTSCSCLEGYSTTDGGATCIADDCTASLPCQNGGLCTGAPPHATCDCDGTGYTGDTCTEDVLECATDNGGCDHTCVENVGAPPTCVCLPGFSSSDGGVTCVADDCPAEFPWVVDGRWCVKHVTRNTRDSWDIAKADCEASGSTLMPIVNQRSVDQLEVLLRSTVSLLCGVVANVPRVVGFVYVRRACTDTTDGCCRPVPRIPHRCGCQGCARSPGDNRVGGWNTVLPHPFVERAPFRS